MTKKEKAGFCLFSGLLLTAIAYAIPGVSSDLRMLIVPPGLLLVIVAAGLYISGVIVEIRTPEIKQ